MGQTFCSGEHYLLPTEKVYTWNYYLLTAANKGIKWQTTHDNKPSLTSWQWLSWSRNYLYLWRYAKQLVTPIMGQFNPISICTLLWSCIKPSLTKFSFSHRISKYVHPGNNFQCYFPWSDTSRRGITPHIQNICTGQHCTVYCQQHSNQCNLQHPGTGD